MAGTFPEAWEEVALVTLQKASGTAYLFAAVTETIDISEPDYPGESIPNIAGGRIWKQSAQEDGEVTLEIYPQNLDTTAGKGLFQEFVGGTWDTGGALATDITWAAGIDRARDKFMIVIMWTDDTTITTAALVNDPSPSTATDKLCLRFYAKECRITSHKTSFTDGIVKTTVTLKFPDMNKAGAAKSWAWESTDEIAATPVSALSY